MALVKDTPDIEKVQKHLFPCDRRPHIESCPLAENRFLFHYRITLLWNAKYLFTGEHFAWVSGMNRFGSFRNACWYSWGKQIDSVKKMESFKKWNGYFPAMVNRGRLTRVISRKSSDNQHSGYSLFNKYQVLRHLDFVSL